MEFKVVIADSDPEVCQRLIHFIRFEELGLTLSGIAGNGKELLGMIESSAPDIVVTDIHLPILDGLSVVQLVRQAMKGCRFIVTGQRQPDDLYRALKLNVDDYLLKPVTADELNRSLKRLREQAASSGAQFNPDFQHVVNRLFFSQAKVDFSNRPLSLTVINDTYETNFRPGVFRYAFLKFDAFGELAADFQSFPPRLKKCASMIYEKFDSCCYDVLVDQSYMLLYVLFNYPEQNERLVGERLEECLQEIKASMLDPGTEAVTVGLSQAYPDMSESRKPWTEAAEAIWARFSKGTGKVIYWEPDGKMPPSIQQKIEVLEKNLKIACSLLDLDEFKHSMNMFFQMPKEILGRSSSRVLMRNIENYMFDINRGLISSFADADLLQREMMHALRKTNTLEEYKDCYIFKMTFVLTQIIDHANLRKSKPIRQARYYIEQNFTKDITLADIAGQVGFSPVYFSYLFKKETGGNITDYINDRRICYAKELLERGGEKITGIASKAGFASPKYFSKIFKMREGLTPAEYRKLKNG